MTGQSINDLLEVDFSWLEFSNTDLENEIIPLNEFLSTYEGNVPDENLYMNLTKAHSLNKSFQVVVSITLSNGENYIVNSEAISFL